jgi:hypothetical protein
MRFILSTLVLLVGMHAGAVKISDEGVSLLEENVPQPLVLCEGKDYMVGYLAIDQRAFIIENSEIYDAVVTYSNDGISEHLKWSHRKNTQTENMYWLTLPLDRKPEFAFRALLRIAAMHLDVGGTIDNDPNMHEPQESFLDCGVIPVYLTNPDNG